MGAGERRVYFNSLFVQILHEYSALAEPLATRSQVQPGNEIREVLPPLVQDLNKLKKKAPAFRQEPQTLQKRDALIKLKP